MDRPQDSQLPTKSTTGPGKTNEEQTKAVSKKYYLVLYNLVSAALWMVINARSEMVAASDGYDAVFAATFDIVKITQTLAVLEILHAAVGIVRTPILTTIMQVSSRLLLVWGIAYQFPSTTAASPAYLTMLIAWSATEVVRYSYFAIIILFGGVPSFLTWLRYNLFFVLYPLGISSECWLVYKAIEPAQKQQPGLEYGLYAILAIYIPGSYILFTHMMAQRRKVMHSLKGQPKKNN